MKKITLQDLKKWDACSDGIIEFEKKFTDGTLLKEAINFAVEIGKDEWGYWLFKKCQENESFKDQAIEGYRNSGNWNSGYRNSGNCNSGDWNSGDWNSGYRNSGYRNSGYRNSGNCNSGDWNSGYRNSGYRNSGDWNSGDWNSGYRNSGYRNSGDWNSGDRNSGNCNSGDRNSGDWNSGNWNSGSFNTITPNEILLFNKPIKQEIWIDCIKPSFIFFELTKWVNEADMTNEEKKENPAFYVAGGYLKTIPYKDAWRKSWDNASDKDRRLVLELPNFDANVFEEISGIDVVKELGL